MNLKYLFTAFLFLFSFYTNAQHVVISNTKMNVVYIGFHNSIHIAVSNHSAEAISVKVSQGTIVGKKGRYSWNPTTKGKATITVFIDNKEIKTIEYRVKTIPYVIARVGHKDSGTISVGEMKAQSGVGAWVANEDMNAKCKMLSYKVTLVAKDKDPVVVINQGARFNQSTRKLIDTVKSGDIIYFETVKCQCPGDTVFRKLNDVILSIR